MAIYPTGQFVESRCLSFCESPTLVARNESGVATSASASPTASFGCACYRIGYFGFDANDWDEGGAYSSLGFALFTPDNQSITDDECWCMATLNGVSEPDPADPEGTAQSTTTSIMKTCSGSSGPVGLDDSPPATYAQEDSSTGSGTHWTSYNSSSNLFFDSGGGGQDPDSKTVSISGTQIVVTWVWTGTWVDSGMQTQNWTQTATLTFDDPLSVSAFCTDASDLFLSLSAGTTTEDFYSLDGGTTVQLTSPGWSGMNATFLSNTTDIPKTAGEYSAGALFSGNAGEGTISISGVRYKVSGAQGAEYTRTADELNARLSADSKLIPFINDAEYWVIPTSTNLSTLSSLVAWQRIIELASNYTVPDPDFPAPN